VLLFESPAQRGCRRPNCTFIVHDNATPRQLRFDRLRCVTATTFTATVDWAAQPRRKEKTSFERLHFRRKRG